MYHHNSFEFKCNYAKCDSSFPRRKLLEIHLRIHRNETTGCSFCPYRTNWEGSLGIHYNSHMKIKSYECDKCPKYFGTQAQLNKHYQKHEELFYRCNICLDYKTDTKKNIVYHMQRHHADRVERFLWMDIKNYITKTW